MANTNAVGRPRRPSRETILIVEDEAVVRRLFVKALTGYGYRVLEAGDGGEGLEVFARHATSVDLLLTDLRMPTMGGVELAERVRAQCPSMKVLCMSGYPSGDISHLGADFLAKPFSCDLLLAKVREILDREP
jgi:CheY-like chemotaxis protein